MPLVKHRRTRTVKVRTTLSRPFRPDRQTTDSFFLKSGQNPDSWLNWDRKNSDRQIWNRKSGQQTDTGHVCCPPTSAFSIVLNIELVSFRKKLNQFHIYLASFFHCGFLLFYHCMTSRKMVVFETGFNVMPMMISVFSWILMHLYPQHKLYI